MTNEGLITANEVEIYLPEDDDYIFNTTIDKIDILPNTTVQIPVIMERITNSPSKVYYSDCIEFLEIDYCGWYECGPFEIWVCGSHNFWVSKENAECDGLFGNSFKFNNLYPYQGPRNGGVLEPRDDGRWVPAVIILSSLTSINLASVVVKSYCFQQKHCW